MTLDAFADVARQTIARDGFPAFIPMACFPARDDVYVLEGVPVGADVETIATCWAFGEAPPEEEVLVAFKVDARHFKIVRRIGTEQSDAVFTVDWPWDQPPNCAVITQRAILEEGAPVLLVTHDRDDNGWQFLNGDDVATETARVVGLRRMSELDQSLQDLADLPPGWRAWRRSATQPWTREPTPR